MDFFPPHPGPLPQVGEGINGFGDWGGFYDFFSDNIWGEALLKVGTSAGSVALNTYIAGELGGGPGRSASGGQVFYAPYNALPGVAPAVTPSTAPFAAPAGMGSDASTWFEPAGKDYTPWIVAGAGALLLLAVLS
jgi:hypothetical protein